MRRERWFLMLGLALLIVPFVAADVEREQEEIALAWIKAHNSGDVAEMAAVRERYFKRSTVTEWKPGFQRLVGELGQLEVRGVMIEGPGRIMIGVNSAAQQERLRLAFEFHEDDPRQIRQIGLDGGGPGGEEDAIPTVDFSPGWKERRGELDAYLKQLSADGLFSGAVLVAERDGIRFSGAYGLASREFDVPNTLATRFDIGSCTKDFTRLAIHQLAGAGKLQLSDTVGRHLPDYPNAEVRAQVTIAQLLDHTSGLGDYFDDDWWKTPMRDLREVEDYIAIWGAKPLQGKPGERESYTNYGYTVLGAIIEKVSGQSYSDYIVEHVFGPAGMRDSGFFETDAIVPNLAVGTRCTAVKASETSRSRTSTSNRPRGGRGARVSRRWMTSIVSMSECSTIRSPAGGDNWLAGAWSGGLVLAGGGPGLSAVCWIEDGMLVIVLANMDMPIAETLASSLSERL